MSARSRALCGTLVLFCTGSREDLSRTSHNREEAVGIEPLGFPGRYRYSSTMSSRRVAWFALVLLAATALVSLWRLSPRVDEGGTPVSLGNLTRHVAAIATEPHPVESAANRRVRDYILGELRLLGLSPQVQTGAIISPRGREVVVENIVCRIPANDIADRSAAGGALLACHYDSHPRAPGAGDDGSAVAGMLEIARLLCESPRLLRDIVLLFTDGEEAGLLGAQVWVRDYPDLMDCRVVANFDARGSSGPAVMFETAGAPVDLFFNGYARASPHPVTSSLAWPVYERMPNGTDFTVFRLAGMSGLNFAFIGAVQNYHTRRDDPAHLSDASLLHQAVQMHQVARYFATAPPERFARNSADGPLELVYFDVASLFVIAYPAWLAMPLALFSAVSVGAGIYRLRPRMRMLVPSLIRLLGCMLVVAAWMHLVSKLPMQTLTHRWTPLAFAGAACVALAALPFISKRGARSQRTTTAVVLALLSLGSLAAGFIFPPGSYVLLFPTLTLGLAACAPVRYRATALSIAAAVATLILLPLTWLVTVAMTIRLLAAPAVLLVLIAWLWQPALAPLLKHRWRIAGILIALAAGAFAIVFFA